jgi:hypothetical protein
MYVDEAESTERGSRWGDCKSIERRKDETVSVEL